MERPDDVRTSQKSPIDTTGPRDATSRPTMSVTSPTQGSSSISAACGIRRCRGVLIEVAILSVELVDQSAFNFSQLCFHRSVQNALRGFEEDFTGFQSGVRRQHQILRRSALLQRLADQALERRMQSHAVNLPGLDLHESRFD